MITLVLLVALFAVACSSTEPAEDGEALEAGASPAGAAETGEDDSTEEPAAGVDADGVLRVAMQFFGGQDISLDSRTMVSSIHGHILNLLYDPLVDYDAASNSYTPNMAEYEVIDPQTVSFTIREGATFHDGRPVTAADAKTSIEQTKANEAEGTCRCNANIALVDTVEVVDERTFTVTTSEPGVAALFELMTGPEFMIVPADAGGSQSSEPVGNGPFQFDSMTEGQTISLVAWDGHPRAADVQLAGVVFVNLEPGNAQTNALLAGDVDFVTEVGLAEHQTLESRDGFTGLADTNDYEFLYMPMCKADGHVYSDPRVRQALMYGMDREQFNDAVYGGFAVMTAAMFPPGHPYYDPAIDEMYPHDEAQARQLLEEAGVVGTSDRIWAASSNAAYEDAALVFGEMMSELGLELSPAPTDDIVSDYLRPSSEGTEGFDGSATIITHTRPGLQKLTRTYGENLVNSCGWENERVTEIIAELQGLAPDSAAAADLWKEAQMINVEEAAYPIFGFYPVFIGWSDAIGGVDAEALDAPTQGGYPFEAMSVTAS